MKESLRHFWAKSKFLSEEILIVLLIMFVGTASFGLGRLSVGKAQKEPVRITEDVLSENQTASVTKPPITRLNLVIGGEGITTSSSSGEVVASKNGKVYHLPWCPGALKIKPENLIKFASAKEAESAGLTPASNCKGL